MELVAVQTYREPTFELWPGDDTIGLEISEDQKKQMLEDFPTKLQVIEDVEGYVKDKTERLLALAKKEQEDILAQYEDAFPTRAEMMTYKEDSFEKSKDFIPEDKEKDLEIETPEAKQSKGKRK